MTGVQSAPGGAPRTPGSDSSTALRGRTLLLARALWLMVAAAAITLSIAGQPTLYRDLRSLTIYDEEQQAIVRENLATLGLSTDVYAAYFLALPLVLALVSVAVAVIIFYQRSDQPMALFIALLLVLLGATFSNAIGAPGGSALLQWLQSVLAALSLLTVILVLFLFPDGRFVPRWTRWAALLMFVLIVPGSFVPGSPIDYDNWPGLVYGLFMLSMVVIGIIAQIYRYRRISGYWQRQQTKWVVLGFVLALVGYTIIASLPEFSSAFQPGTVAEFIAAAAIIGFMLLIPLSFGVAMLRYHLWDVDLVITRTLVYSLVTGLLLIAYGVSVIALQGLFRAATGQSSALAIIVSTLVVASMFQPLRSRVQRFIDRRYYRRRYDVTQTLTTFGARVRNEIDLQMLTGELVGVVRETMQPESVMIWLPPSVSADEQRRRDRPERGLAEIRVAGRFLVS